MKRNPLWLLIAIAALVLIASACATPTPSNIPFATPTAQGRTIGATFVGEDGATMLFVPAGDSLMGSTDQQVADYTQQERNDIPCARCVINVTKYDYEKPQHLVYLNAFWMDKFNVTNALYKKCVDAGKCSAPVLHFTFYDPDIPNYNNPFFGGSQFDNYPVIGVSWDDAKNYCTWADKRLPTEAEWEKAARGSEGQIYPWGFTYDDKMRSQNRGVDAVDSRPANVSPYGIMDMVGNVQQWVNDWYGERQYSQTLRSNPPGPQPFLPAIFQNERVLRGGGWEWPEAREQRVARRFHDYPTVRTDYIGFRCAKDYAP